MHLPQTRIHMDSSSHRPWEGANANSRGPPGQPQQKLPSITAFMQSTSAEKRQLDSSPSALQRDSGAWSLPHSTRSSAYSASTMPYLNSSQPSPNRLSGSDRMPFTPDTSAAPSSAGPQPSPGGSSSQQNTTLPSINQNFDPAGQKGAGDHQDSCSNGFDLRVNQGMDRLALNGQSPYGSTNASQSSLVSGLQRERGIQNNGSGGGGRTSGVTSSPLSCRTTEPRSGFNPRRTAPIIADNPRSDIYNAERPTAGQAYAFPDPDAPNQPADRAQSTYSGRDSYAESFNGSIYTNDSRLPAGQHELPGSLHHHTLQHKQVSETMHDPDSPNGSSPYSRTPELRKTHKLAERKRRSDMKEYFEMLRARLPPSQSNKASKGETLTRAIDYITHLENSHKSMRDELVELRRRDAEQHAQLEKAGQQLSRYSQQPNQAPFERSVGPVFGGHFPPNPVDPPRTLPPLMNGGGSSAMQGIQYPDDRR